MDLQNMEREICQIDNLCSDSTDGVIDLVPNEDGASISQESYETEPMQLNVIVNQVSSAESCNIFDANLA